MTPQDLINIVIGITAVAGVVIGIYTYRDLRRSRLPQVTIEIAEKSYWVDRDAWGAVYRHPIDDVELPAGADMSTRERADTISVDALVENLQVAFRSWGILLNGRPVYEERIMGTQAIVSPGRRSHNEIKIHELVPLLPDHTRGRRHTLVGYYETEVGRRYKSKRVRITL